MFAWSCVHDIIKMPRHLVDGALSLKRQGRAPLTGDGRRWREKGDCEGKRERGHLETHACSHCGGPGAGDSRHLRRGTVVA